MWRIAEIMRQSGEALIRRLGISNGLPPIPGNRSSSNGHGSAQIALPTAGYLIQRSSTLGKQGPLSSPKLGES
jgi:hypothetical protein